MSNLFRRLFASLLILSSVFPAVADDDADRARQKALAGIIMPLAQILQRTELNYPGQVLDVELDDDDDNPTYEIRLMQQNGRVVEIEVDAKTGTVTDVDEDD